MLNALRCEYTIPNPYFTEREYVYINIKIYNALTKHSFYYKRFVEGFKKQHNARNLKVANKTYNTYYYVKDINLGYKVEVEPFNIIVRYFNGVKVLDVKLDISEDSIVSIITHKDIIKNIELLLNLMNIKDVVCINKISFLVKEYTEE